MPIGKAGSQRRPLSGCAGPTAVLGSLASKKDMASAGKKGQEIVSTVKTGKKPRGKFNVTTTRAGVIRVNKPPEPYTRKGLPDCDSQKRLTTGIDSKKRKEMTQAPLQAETNADGKKSLVQVRLKEHDR